MSARLLALLAFLCWSCTAGAAITEIASTTAASANGNATTLTIAVPTGTVARDVMLVQIDASKAAETVTPPAGWTQVRSESITGITQALFYRIVTGTEPASYAFGLSSAAGVVGSMTTFRGVDTGAPIQGSSGQTGALLTDTAPAIATCQAGTLQVAFFGFNGSLLSLTISNGLATYTNNSTNVVVGLTIVTAARR